MRKFAMFAAMILLGGSLSACARSEELPVELSGSSSVDNAAVETSAQEAAEAASEDDRAAVQGKKIGFCGMTFDNEYHIILTNAVIKACEEEGIECEARAGSEHGSVDDQVEILRDYIAEGVDGIILVPTSSDHLTEVLQECAEAGIPVINLDTKLSDATLAEIPEEIPFYGTDNYVGGQLSGEYFAELYPDAGTRVGILRGIQDQLNDRERYEGFLSTAGEVDLAQEAHCDWETEKAYQAAKEMIHENPDLEVLYCENDLMGLGAVKAIRELGKYGQIKVFSYDGIVAGLQAVIDGDFVTTCAQQPIEMGFFGVENMIKIFQGKEPESYIDTGCRLVTSENAQMLLDITREYTDAIPQQ